LLITHHQSGQDEVLVGTPVAGRGRTELEGPIAFQVLGLSGNPPF